MSLRKGIGFCQQSERMLRTNVIKLRNDGFEENTKNVLLFFL